MKKGHLELIYLDTETGNYVNYRVHSKLYFICHRPIKYHTCRVIDEGACPTILQKLMLYPIRLLCVTNQMHPHIVRVKQPLKSGSGSGRLA